MLFLAFDQLCTRTVDLLGVNGEFLADLNKFDDEVVAGKKEYKDIGKVRELAENSQKVRGSFWEISASDLR